MVERMRNLPPISIERHSSLPEITMQRLTDGRTLTGVIDLSFYDMLVLRARYSHVITRILPPADDRDHPAGGGGVSLD